MRKNLDFQTRRDELLKAFEATKEVVLSTCSANRVTSRVVSTACHEDKIYFLSWEHHVKCLQIRDNPQVAFCHANIQIEGNASILGNSLDRENIAYSEKYKVKQPGIFEAFTKFQGMVIVEVSITKIRSYVQENGEYCLDCLNFAEKKAYRENMKIGV